MTEKIGILHTGNQMPTVLRTDTKNGQQLYSYKHDDRLQYTAQDWKLNNNNNKAGE